MSELDKQQWREWFLAHPEWVKPVADYVNRNSGVVARGPFRKFWHDLVNALVPAYAKLSKKG